MQNSNNFYIGIEQDIDPKYQKEGTYRFALNAVLETTDGDAMNISSELGNTTCALNFPSGKQIIGHALTYTTDIILFLKDNKLDRPIHEIGRYNPVSCNYTTIAKGESLNFDKPINVIYRVKNGCVEYVYFTDSENVYRVANITDTTEWVNQSTKVITNINKIAYSRPYSIPVLDDKTSGVVDNLGQLDYGTYTFYIRYLDIELNPINRWIPLTNSIPVFYGADTTVETASSYGASNNIANEYYKPKANKGIELTINSLDNSFPYYQLAVVRKNSDSDVITSVDLLYPQPRANNLFKYNNIDNIIDTSSIDDILSEDVKIDTVKAHAVDDNRLFIANTSTKYRDYSLYQRYASKIRVRYKTTSSNGRTSKNPDSYILPKSLMKNEIIALGIVFVHNDGSESPVFHLPGRAANIPQVATHTNPYIPGFINWDTDDITGDVNIINNAQTARWQVYNTASMDPTSTITSATGYLGYYQVTPTYPSMTACDGGSYWGTDYWNNNLTGTNIRHHKIPPDYNYVSNGNNTSGHSHYRVELQLDNVTFPTDVQGYYLVYSDEETQVIDRGYFTPMLRDVKRLEETRTGPNYDQTYYHAYIECDDMDFFATSVNPNGTIFGTVPPDGTTYWDIGTAKFYSFISPKTVYQGRDSSGDYIVIDKILSMSGAKDRSAVFGELDVNDYDSTIGFNSFLNDYDLYTRPASRINYKVRSSYYLDKSGIFKDFNMPSDDASQLNARSEINVSNTTLQNRSKNHDINVFELFDTLYEMSNPTSPGTGINNNLNGHTYVVSVMSTKDVFTNLYNINYKRLNPNIIKTTSPVTLQGGNSFASYFDTVEHYWENDPTPGDVTSYHSFVSGKFDSKLNSEARNYSNAERGKFTYYQHVKENDFLGFRRYIASKYYQETVDEGLFYTENYSLNERYNSFNPLNIYYPIQFNYDFCNLCIDENPHRIYYSNTDNTESTVDLYRQIKPNNYKDIDGTYGPITDLFRAFNNLYLTTNQTIKLLPTKPQALETDLSNIFIGTGDVLSLPLQSITSPDFAMGGLQHFKARTSTEFGTFYIDEYSGRPLLLTSNLNDLSKGLRNFWENNGQLKLITQVKKLTNSIYTHNNTITGVGYMTTYDPRFKRLIIHKRDYEIVSKYTKKFALSTTSSIITPLTLWSDGRYFYYNNASGTPAKVNFDDSEYFVNKSFTISYSFISNSWVSFHSYFPIYMFNDHDTFYSGNIYKHNSGEYQTYYNKKYSHVVDMVTSVDPLQSKNFSSVMYSSKCTKPNNITGTFENVDYTYDGLIAYNNYQTTGYMGLAFKGTDEYLYSDYNTAYVSKVDSLYRINDIRDMTLDNNLPIWTNEWFYLQTEPYLDKVPNSSNIDFYKPFYEQSRMRDHYIGLRFFFNPQLNYKISTDLVTITHNEKVR